MRSKAGKAPAKFSFKTKMDAFKVIRGAAASGNEKLKKQAIAAAHKKWPPKKAAS